MIEFLTQLTELQRNLILAASMFTAGLATGTIASIWLFERGENLE